MKSAKTLAVVVAVIMAVFAAWAASPVLSDVSLPAPRTDGGKPLMQALKDRQTSRDFSNKREAPPSGIVRSSLGGIRHQPARLGKAHRPLRQELARD